MKSDLTCPVEITDVSIDKSGENIICILDFLNLSDRIIQSIQMNIICFSENEERLGGRLVRSSVEGAPNAEFSGRFVPEHAGDTARIEAAVEKIWYRDGIVWRREERNVREYEPNILPAGSELDRLKRVAGSDARGYPRMDDKVWLCVCGRANSNSSDICMRCGRQRTFVLNHYSFEVIDSTEGFKERTRIEKTRETLEENARKQALEDKAIREKQKRKRKRTTRLIAVLCVLAAALAAYRWIIPLSLCAYGDRLRTNGKPTDAKRFYEIVERYWPNVFSATQKVNDTEMAIIDSMISDGGNDALRQAIQRANLLNDSSRLLKAQIALADKLIESGEDEEAETLLRGIVDSSEADERLHALLYRQAMVFKESVDYPNAIEKFSAAKDYQDAPNQRMDCIYLYGRQLAREGKYAEACAQFEQITGYEDSISMLRNSRYLMAGKLRLEGRLTEAAGLYESLGLYEDAAELSLVCHFEAGLRAIEAGELVTAAEQFVLAEPYEDAEDRFIQCAEVLAERAAIEQDWESAIGWLIQLPRVQVQDKLDSAVYAWAEELLKSGRRNEAALEFASLGDYSDAASRYQAIEYEIASKEMAESPEEALLRFEGLKGYLDSDELAQQCRLRHGLSLMDTALYEEAVEVFEGLSDQNEKDNRINQCQYAWAEDCLTAGEYEKAASLFALCGTYQDSEERTRDARYRGALALEQKGDYVAAIAAFDALGGYSDAKTAKERCEDARLKEPFIEAQMDLDVGNYLRVIQELEVFQKETLPTRYADIRTLYTSACLGQAQELIGLGKPLDALPYLERIPENRSAAKRLNDYVYRIIGRWKDTHGVEYVFRRDGSCRINDQEAFFGGSGYEIDVGPEPYPKKAAYSVISLRRSVLTLKQLSTGKNTRLTYLGEPAIAPIPNESEYSQTGIDEKTEKDNHGETTNDIESQETERKEGETKP